MKAHDGVPVLVRNLGTVRKGPRSNEARARTTPGQPSSWESRNSRPSIRWS